MDKIKFKNETETLAQLLCSSYYQSHSKGLNLSIEEISSDLYKTQKIYDEVFLNCIRDFDGYTRKDVSKKFFTKAQENVKIEMNNLILDLKFPAPIPDESDDIKSPYLIDSDYSKKVESPLLKEWFKKYQNIRGEYVYKFKSEDIEEFCIDLLEVGKYKIKFDAFQRAASIASFEGEYIFEHTFNNVPEACRYLDKILKYVSFDAILERVRSDEIKIIKDGKQVIDNNILYNQAYSWWKNQLNKGRNIPKE